MKKILAIVLALALALGAVMVLTSCGGKDVDEPETTTASEAVTDDAAGTEIDATEEATAADETTAAEETTAEETTVEATTVEETTAAEKTTAEAAAKAPSTTEEILALYNKAVNGAAKAGYSKTRVCNINSLEGGAILKLQVAKDAVYSFLGVGTNSWKNTKGKAEYMGKASLAAGDVTGATCTEKDGKYTVVINVKDGKSSAPGGSDSSPLAKTGLYTGEGDKGEYDYKNAANIYYALNNTDGAALGAASLNATGGKITATINAKSGKLEKLEVKFNFSVVLTDVKYTIAKIKEGTGSATTTVTFKDFAY